MVLHARWLPHPCANGCADWTNVWSIKRSREPLAGLRPPQRQCDPREACRVSNVLRMPHERARPLGWLRSRRIHLMRQADATFKSAFQMSGKGALWVTNRL